MTWVLLVLTYGIMKGLREVIKKKALETNSIIEVLFLYTFISFIFVTPEIRNAGGLTAGELLMIAVKSFAVFIAWIASFNAVKHIPVSIYGIVDQSRVIFATLFGVLVLGEAMGAGQLVGLTLVILGMVLLKVKPRRRTSGTNGDEVVVAERENVPAKYIVYIFVSAFFNAFSGFLDKVLMSRGTIGSGQLQFWYMLFMVAYYGIYIVVGKPEMHWKSALKNGWIWVLAVLFVIADRCLFIANADPDSRITVMTLIKQSSCIVTILGGRIVFKEKELARKLICAFIVVSGIVLSVLL